mmetsp:Transcript_107790/g.197954  ORF Transcript_107790/g.197954 Transcript_107790/m.197954 type:complete len:343 (-) Transcript_107790:80-1108(-)
MGVLTKCTVCLPLFLVLFTFAFSFFAGGWVCKYLRNPQSFTLEALPDLQGQVAVVTGANTGIGYITARELVRKGAQVIIGVRTDAKGAETLKKIEAETGRKAIYVAPLDLSSLKSVKSFASEVTKQFSALTLLVNNAGVMACPWGQTSDGLEMQFGTNHIGHFALTSFLLGALKKGGTTTKKSRVVVLSSNAHTMGPPGGLDVGSWIRPHGDWYEKWTMYGQSKISNIMFAKELDRQLLAESANVLAVALHPGFVVADLARHLTGVEKFMVKDYGYGAVALTTEDGALTTLYAATHDSIEALRGEYFEPLARRVDSHPDSYNVTTQKFLWTESEAIVKKILR